MAKNKVLSQTFQANSVEVPQIDSTEDCAQTVLKNELTLDKLQDQIAKYKSIFYSNLAVQSQ